MKTFHTKKSSLRTRHIFENLKIDVCDLLRLKIADHYGKINPGKKEDVFNIRYLRNILGIIKESKKVNIDLKINGDDIMKIKNIKPGKKVGEIKQYLINVILDDPSKNEYEILKEIVLNYI